jgi:hypothetical protein
MVGVTVNSHEAVFMEKFMKISCFGANPKFNSTPVKVGVLAALGLFMFTVYIS